MKSDSQAVKAYLLDLQRRIVAGLESVDGAAFTRDEWRRIEGESAGLGGHGVGLVIEDSHVFERGGVNFSHVTGRSLPPAATASRAEFAGRGFEAMGISLVMHPRNPYCPTVHMNVRFLIARKEGEADVWWFGGGMDLTPFYGFEKDAARFHGACKTALDPFGAGYYPRFKQGCDEYFYLKHRGEPRGIGGVFFDDFSEPGFETSFALTRALGDAFLPAYVEIIARRKSMEHGERERDWQCIRRGRYVEFNLVFDRGTHFGLQSGGRTESILMSLPPLVKWCYNRQPAPGSPEARLLTDFLIAREWV